MSAYDKVTTMFKREMIGIGLLIAALGGLWLWQQQQAAPLPPNATNVNQTVTTLARETTASGPWSEEELRAFYRQSLPGRGWAYCGDQTTPGCANLFKNIPLSDGRIDVYRRQDDQSKTGRTIEIWPQPRPSRMDVLIVETRAEERPPQ
jgi:hypothetical protein